MLKLTYEENGFCLESLTESLEIWVNTRTSLAQASGFPYYSETTTAAFPIVSSLTHFAELLNLIQEQPDENVNLSLCDNDSVEIQLQGTWLSCHPASVEGVFVTTLSDRAESIIRYLWQISQASASVL
ncbi:MAG: alr0857 family protein [Microcystaceae cyanobacterium]